MDGPNFHQLHHDGMIDELAVYERALSGDEIRQDMIGVQATAVAPRGKLTTAWGSVKRARRGK
jgi:hypothetical protein